MSLVQQNFDNAWASLNDPIVRKHASRHHTNETTYLHAASIQALSYTLGLISSGRT